MGLIKLAALAALSAVASAQTFTNCNPLNATCPPNVALGQYAEFDWTQNHLNPDIWNSTSTPLGYGQDGSEFTVVNQGDSPNINTNFYIFFGTLSVVMKASKGQGIISSIVLLSDDLDEVDWEILGGNRTVVESNYFGKGDDSTFDRAKYHQVDWAPQDDFHNYTFDWNKDRLQWIVDGKILRELTYADAQGGKWYPQTPMKVHLGSWAGGDPRNPKGTIEWAGGETDYKSSPYTMNIKNVYIQDASTGSEYTYTDHSGSYQSIKTTAGQSSIIPELNKKVGVKAHWNDLSQGTQIAIIAGSIAGFLLLVGTIAFCCIRSTRKGLREHAKAEAEWEAQRKEADESRRVFREQQRLSSMNSASTRAWSHNEFSKH